MYGKYVASAQDIAQQEKIFNDAASASQKQLYRDSTAGKKLADYEKQITDTGTTPGNLLDSGNSFVTLSGPLATLRSPRIAVNPATGQFNQLKSADLVTASLDQLDSLKNTENSIITSVLDNAKSVRSDAQQTALLFAVGAVGAILIALIIAFYVARAVTVPLKKLTSAAYTLSTDKLPALVERLRNPDKAVGSLSETLTPIDITLEGRDRPAGRSRPSTGCRSGSASRSASRWPRRGSAAARPGPAACRWKRVGGAGELLQRHGHGPGHVEGDDQGDHDGADGTEKNSRAVCWASLRTDWASSSTVVMIEFSVFFSESSWSSEAVTRSARLQLVELEGGLVDRDAGRPEVASGAVRVTKELLSSRWFAGAVPVSVICFS